MSRSAVESARFQPTLAEHNDGIWQGQDPEHEQCMPSDTGRGTQCKGEHEGEHTCSAIVSTLGGTSSPTFLGQAGQSSQLLVEAGAVGAGARTG